MKVNANFDTRVVVHGSKMDWLRSPIPGVERRMLDRIGDEVARATSIVRYAPGSAFSPHVHTGGEEFVVLEGVFQDEHGDFEAGAYVRNPPQSSHTPGSAPGCVIFVKLWQFDLQDRHEVKIPDLSAHLSPVAGQSGVLRQPLHEDAREVVGAERWAPHATIEREAEGGIEVFVLEGSFEEGKDLLERWSWLRLPMGTPLRARVGPHGALVWMKTGHLAYAAPPSGG